MKVPILYLALSSLLALSVRSQETTETIFDGQQAAVTSASYTVLIGGANAAGETTYGVKEVATVDGQLVTVYETLIENASVEIGSILPTATGGVGYSFNCTVAADGTSHCVEKVWVSGNAFNGETVTTTYTGSAMPIFTASQAIDVPNVVITSFPTETAASSTSSDAITNHSNTRAVVGGVVGGILGFLLLGLISVWLVRQRNIHLAAERRKKNRVSMSRLSLDKGQKGQEPPVPASGAHSLYVSGNTFARESKVHLDGPEKGLGVGDSDFV